MDIKSYRVIVERLGIKNSSDFLNDITIQGYLPAITKPNILSFKTIDEAVEAAKIHSSNWHSLHQKSDFGYDIVPVYDNEEWGESIKRLKKRRDHPIEEIE